MRYFANLVCVDSAAQFKHNIQLSESLLEVLNASVSHRIPGYKSGYPCVVRESRLDYLHSSYGGCQSRNEFLLCGGEW